MAGWHHQHYGYEFDHTLGDSDGQGNLACCLAHGATKSWTRLSNWTKISVVMNSSNCLPRCVLDPAIPPLGIYPEKTIIEKDTHTPVFIAAPFIIARTWNQPGCPWRQPICLSTEEWVKKLWYIYTMKYYSGIQGNEFESVLVRWMNPEPVIQSEVSQKEKSKLLHLNADIWNLEKRY